MSSNKVLDSAQFINNNSSDVKVDEHGCKKAAEAIFKAMQKKEYTTKAWSLHPLHPNPADKDPITIINWIFTVDLLNFSFWSDVDPTDTGKAESARYAVEYNGVNYTGYWSMVAAINKALDNGIDITTPSKWIDGSLDLKEIFKSVTNEPIPLLEYRVEVLKEAGQVMSQQGYSNFASIVAAADKSALRLLDMVTSFFGSFNDIAVYKGKNVAFYKRAQILISDIWACFGGQEYGEFVDIDEITMFADYRIPQILRTLQCLWYSDPLASHLMSLYPVEPKSDYEIELRGCSIWAVEVIKREILKNHPTSHINSVLIDFYLWDTAKELQEHHGGDFDIPCHRTRTIFY